MISVPFHQQQRRSAVGGVPRACVPSALATGVELLSDPIGQRLHSGTPPIRSASSHERFGESVCCQPRCRDVWRAGPTKSPGPCRTQSAANGRQDRSEEHTSELQSLMRNSYAVFCLKKKK